MIQIQPKQPNNNIVSDTAVYSRDGSINTQYYGILLIQYYRYRMYRLCILHFWFLNVDFKF